MVEVEREEGGGVFFLAMGWSSERCRASIHLGNNGFGSEWFRHIKIRSGVLHAKRASRPEAILPLQDTDYKPDMCRKCWLKLIMVRPIS